MKKILFVTKCLTLILFLISLSPPVNAQDFNFPTDTTKTISMDFKSAAIMDVLKIFSQQSGLNFIASEDIADKKITLFLDKVPVEAALDRILKANSLTYEMEPSSNVFIVKTVSRSPEELLTRVYHLKFATVKSSKLNQTIAISATSSQDSNSSNSSGSSNSSFSGQTGSSSSEGLAAAMKTVLTKSGNIIEDSRTNSLIVTDIPSQFPVIEQTIARLDVPIPEILIEVEMLDISKKTSDLLGIKYGDTPLSFTGAVRNMLYPFNQNDLIQAGKFAFNSTGSSSTTTTSTSTTSSTPATGTEYSAGSISAAGLTAILQFLRTQTDTKNLARPRILTLNNETAQIKISTSEAVGLLNVTGSSQSTATQTVQAERVQTGISLTVTPQANLTTGDITMAIAPKVVEARTGGTFGGQTFKDPEERGTKSILRVHDGNTIMLGGLFRTDLSTTVTKVPVLGDIPIVGGAFRHKANVSTERELVIFITPHIVSDSNKDLLSPREYRQAALSPERLSAVDRSLSDFEKTSSQK